MLQDTLTFIFIKCITAHTAHQYSQLTSGALVLIWGVEAGASQSVNKVTFSRRESRNVRKGGIKLPRKI